MLVDIFLFLVVCTLIWWGICGICLLAMATAPMNDGPRPPKVLKPGEWEYKSEPDPDIKAMMEAYRALPDPVAVERLRILREERLRQASRA
jgi:hypothetical protein